MAKATFAAGCFWGVEESFGHVPGVLATTVGYVGGKTENPSYEDVCTGRTGHAEAVQVEFDPDQVSFEQLLDVFWQIHDPTQKDRQGPDVGTQYRSAVFCDSPDQEAAAKASKDKAAGSGRFSRDVVTEIALGSEFYEAEDYHQKYFQKRGIAHRS